MGFKMITLVLPDEVVSLFQPLWEEMDKTECDEQGHSGSVIMDIQRDTGECIAAFFPAKEYIHISETVMEATKKSNKPNQPDPSAGG